MRRMQEILAVLMCMVIVLTGIPVSVQAADSDGTLKTDMPTGQELFIILEENTDYRWNANDNAEKSSVVHLDTSGGDNCRFRLDKIENGWYGIKHIKTDGTDRFADVDEKSKNSGAAIHLWESDDSKVKGNNHRQFAFYYLGDDANGNGRYYIKNRNSGKWLGYEGKLNGNQPKIIQTDTNNRKVWLITKSVVPNTGKESIVLDKNDTSGICEIYKAGQLEAINRKADSLIPGGVPHFYTMGTTSKWRLNWKADYNAYQIESITDGESDTGLSMDVSGESGREGAAINFWSTEKFDKNQNTSQLWRFFKQDDGTYKIQNARSGLFLQDSSGTLKLGKTGTKIDLSILMGEADDTMYSYAEEWMSRIPDDALLSSVNIPSTHDTGTAAVWQDGIPQFSFTSCQKLYYDEQLNVGARSFDIRGNATKEDASPKDVKIVHGAERNQCADRDDNDLTLKAIFDMSLAFLEKHPSETIILTVKPDSGSAVGMEHAVAEFVKKNENSVYSGGNIPSMKEARGKIVLIRRFELTQNYEKWVENAMGLNLTNWDDVTYRDYEYAYKSYDDGTNHVYIQDAYNTYECESYSKKMGYITGTMRQTTGQDTQHPIVYNSWIYNYTSCANGIPLNMTRDINPVLYKDEAGYIDSRFLGMVMLNFIDEPMSRLIYETNQSLKFEPKLPTPEVELNYGETLSEASLNGIEGTVEGTWSFVDAGHVVTEEEVANQTKFELKFEPKDKQHYKSVTMQVPVTALNKTGTITAYLGCEEISYGEIPQIDYAVEPTEMLTQDELDTLFENVTDEMTIAETGQSLNEVIDAGSYTINCPETVGGFQVNWIHLDEYDLVVNPIIITGAQNQGDDMTAQDPEDNATAQDPEDNTTAQDPEDNTIAQDPEDNATAQDPEDNITAQDPEGGTAVQNAQRIVVRAEKKTKDYGEAWDNTNLTFTMSDAEQEKLLPGDTVDSLGLTLKATTIERGNLLNGSTADSDGDEILGAYGNAGNYIITKDSATNSNYNVIVIPAFLTITPKEVSLEWNAEEQYIYTGNSFGIQAQVAADSLLENDSCEIRKLLNAEHTDAGTYRAVAVGLTNANYYLPKTREAHIWKYEILQADPEVTFPNAEVTYGDSLKKAVLTDQAGEGEFRFTNDALMLSTAENQMEQEMIFTPSDPNYKTVVTGIPVTVSPRKVTIKPDRTEKEYGQTISEYTWSVSEGSLAESDQVEDLQVDVTLTAGDAEKEKCSPGIYEITEKEELTAGNANYTVAFESGTLIVQPKPVQIEWNTDGTVIYTGKEANVAAQLNGVLDGDDCKAVVEGGDAVKTGTYTAEVTGLTGEESDNYVLHEAEENSQKEYQIVAKDLDKNSDKTTSDESKDTTGGKKNTGKGTGINTMSGKNAKTAKTGDSIEGIWILAMAGALAVIGGVAYRSKSRKKR